MMKEKLIMNFTFPMILDIFGYVEKHLMSQFIRNQVHTK